jgi:ABC-type hemin transport system substrate-binding protein
MRPSSRQRAALLAVLAAEIAACRDPATRTDLAPGAGAPRIVSLSPAITQTLVDLGLGARIVGRSRFCRAVGPDVPAVGDLFDLDYERLLRVRPTHVLLQPSSATGPDPRLLRLAEEQRWTVAHWRIDTIEDIRRHVRELPPVLFPQDQESREHLRGRAEALLQEIEAALEPPAPPPWTGPTLLVADAQGLLVSGRRTYLDDVLSALGGTNAIDAAGWVELSIEDVLRVNPHAVIVVRGREPPGEAGAAGLVGALDIAAARTGRIAVLVHPEVDIPGTSVTGVAREMRRVLERLGGRP